MPLNLPFDPTWLWLLALLLRLACLNTGPMEDALQVLSYSLEILQELTSVLNL